MRYSEPVTSIISLKGGLTGKILYRKRVQDPRKKNTILEHIQQYLKLRASLKIPQTSDSN
jgi:hypothetical protein